jgi:endo-1,4-beta-xylanase
MIMKDAGTGYFRLAAGVLAVFFLTLTACISKSVAVTGIALEKEALALTIGASEKLNYTVTPSQASGISVTWTSSNPNIVSVSDDGTVTALRFSRGGGNTFISGASTSAATVTVKIADGKLEDTITVNATMEALVDMMTLPPMKDQFSGYFLMGNIFNPDDIAANGSSVTNARLNRHYSILTPENFMKPGYLAPDRWYDGEIEYDFLMADNMVNAAIASGFKVHGHTLLWHSQNASWMNQMAKESRETALAAMKEYITTVVRHFAGRIYSWDVLNEVFPDNVSFSSDWTKVMRNAGDSQAANPWYAAIGSDFVYEGYLAARLADSKVILYYNDYNTDQPGKAAMIRDMVRDVNARYATAYPNANRLLIEGIGMQEHHNTGVSAARIKATLDLFRPLGVRISVAELDVLGQGWGSFSSVGSGTNKHDISTVTNQGLWDQARLYGEYFDLYLENSDIIERVSQWGVIDSQSWRSAGLPLLFDPDGRAKPAYYSVIRALEKRQ